MSDNKDMLKDQPSQEPTSPTPQTDGSTSGTGHLADIVSAEGEGIEGGLLWSASGKSFRIVAEDGTPLSNPEAEQIMELLQNGRLAFDNADDHESFVIKMSDAGYDVDNEKIGMTLDSSTDELLIDPETLIGNERHHPSDPSETVGWPDEVNISDPADTGHHERIIGGLDSSQKDDGGQEAKKRDGRKVKRVDDILMALALCLIGFFYLVALARGDSPLISVMWTILCVLCAVVILIPATLRIETRKQIADGKIILSGAMSVVFAIMSVCMVLDFQASGRMSALLDGLKGNGHDGSSKQTSVITQQDQGGSPAMVIDLTSPADMAVLHVAGSEAEYPTVMVNGMLVTSIEAGKTNSLTVSLGGKSYVAQLVTTIGDLDIAVFKADSEVSGKAMSPASSISMDEKAIAISSNGDGSLNVESVTISGTRIPKEYGNGSGIEAISIDKNMPAGTVIVDSDDSLIGIVTHAGNEVTPGTSIVGAVDGLASKVVSGAGHQYIGVSVDQDADEDGDGLYVDSVVSGSPAANAGIRAGDLIVTVDGQEVSDADSLDKALLGHAVGDQIEISVKRDGHELDPMRVTIESRQTS